ncbi:MAG: AAA family ATPase, partial [Alphaproteobacteria bacterium]|nr:AAA family ATPase [Alphaproteobacteria bacterium]
MRITSLHLQAYGHFTGCSLHFGRPLRAPPGLHVVYGHNEAGKSTTLRALSSVLFGYPHGIIDGFKHGAKDIAIGIDLLAADGRTLSFVRRRRGKHALTAADGAVLDEGGVEKFLGGASREMFEKVFALDHHRLREHGKALLADGGSLGFSLAEAGSGIAGLKAVLDRLKAERAGLFLAAGTRPRLNQAIAEFVRLRKEARQHTVSPSEYRGHEKRIQDTEAVLLGARERRKQIESAIVRLERIGKNLPLRAEHRVLTQRIAALPGVPALPPEFTHARIKASADLDVAGADLAIACAAIADLEQRIAAIAVDTDVLLCGDDIESLALRRPVIEQQESERPRWEAERAQLVAAAADLTARAGLAGGPADGDSALPPPVKRKVIQDLAEDGKALMVKSATVREHAEAAACALKKAGDRAAGMARPRPVDALSRALTAADRLGADITSDIARRTSALVRKTKALNDALTGLGVGGDGASLIPLGAGPSPADAGRIALLRELVVPSERTEARYAGRLADLEGKIAKGTDDVGRLSDESADIDRRIAALRIAGDVATEDDLKAARQARDHGWALVRGLYVDRRAGLDDAARRFAADGPVAEAYEARVRDADRAVDSLRARVRESTELAFLRRKAADLKTQQTGASEAVGLLGAQRDAALAEWRALWPAGLITVEAPGEMVDWLARRSAALAAAAELEEERDAVAEVEHRERRARQALAAAMAAFTGEPQDGDIDALRDRARGIIEAAVEANGAYDRAEADLRIMADRKLESDDAVDRLAVRTGEWTEKWRRALG